MVFGLHRYCVVYLSCTFILRIRAYGSGGHRIGVTAPENSHAVPVTDSPLLPNNSYNESRVLSIFKDSISILEDSRL